MAGEIEYEGLPSNAGLGVSCRLVHPVADAHGYFLSFFSGQYVGRCISKFFQLRSTVLEEN